MYITEELNPEHRTQEWPWMQSALMYVGLMFGDLGGNLASFGNWTQKRHEKNVLLVQRDGLWFGNQIRSWPRDKGILAFMWHYPKADFGELVGNRG